jgi:arylsulfatase A-like enzyme
MNSTPRHVLAVFAIALLLARLAALHAADVPQPAKPNIIVILADDLGYGELGCYGGRDAPTPNLDAMARAGLRFTAGYVTCPVCSPSRAALLTGRYQQRFGHENNIAQSWELQHPEFMGLPVEEKTLADRLKAQGYRTAAIGKWHLGTQEKFHPLARGFDEFFGFLEGGRAYLSDDDPGNFYYKSTPPHLQVHFKEGAHAPIYRDREVVAQKQYLTDAFTHEALSFVDAKSDQPFFLYLAYNAVHTPITPCDRWDAKLQHIENPVRRTIASMMAAMDEDIGKLRDHLRQRGMAQNTLLIFLSDNGGSPGGTPAQIEAGAVSYSLNTPLRGFKGECYEGGIRIPYIVEWPGKIPMGVMSDQPVSSLDIVPTALAAAGASPPESTDGVNLLPLLANAQSGPPHEKLFWRFHIYTAVRKGALKLLKRRGQPDELYDLVNDLTESKNLAAEMPQAVAELNQELAAWESQLIPPRWNQQFPLRPDGKPLFPAATATAANLLRNGDVEAGQPNGLWPLAWYHDSSGVQWSTEKALSPKHSLCIEAKATGKPAAPGWRSVAVEVTPGRSYTLTWAWQYDGSPQVAAILRFFDANGKFLTQKTTVTTDSAKRFVRHRMSVVAPPNAASADASFRRLADGADAVFIDDIGLKQE